MDIAGEAIGSISEAIDLDDYLIEGGFNLCAPALPELRLAFQLGIKSAYQKPTPKCDWQSITSNWEGFVQSTTELDSPGEAVLNAFADGLRPGQNTLSFSVETNIKVISKVQEKKQAQFAEMLSKGGFKDVKDIVTGLIKTVVFGMIIALVGCHQGLTVKGGAEGVGIATTTSVVRSFILIIMTDALFTFIFYFLFNA